MIGDHYGVRENRSSNSGVVHTQISCNKTATYGDKEAIASAALRTFSSEFYERKLRKGYLIVPGQIGGADFAYFMPKCNCVAVYYEC